MKLATASPPGFLKVQSTKSINQSKIGDSYVFSTSFPRFYQMNISILETTEIKMLAIVIGSHVEKKCK